MTRPGKSVWDKCDHSALCASSKMWWLHTRMRHNGKWRSGRQIISRMNAFFRNHYSDVPMRATTKRTPQQTDASGGEMGRLGGGWGGREGGKGGREKKKFLSLSWHDKSVCISTPFITFHPRQWIEFQKPINKGDVHSAWQLSQAGVPLSFSPLLPFLLLPPFFCCFFFPWNELEKRERKIKSAGGRVEREEKEPRWDAFMLRLSFHWRDKGEHQGQESGCGEFFFPPSPVNWMRLLRVIVRSRSAERCLEGRGSGEPT